MLPSTTPRPRTGLTLRRLAGLLFGLPIVTSCLAMDGIEGTEQLFGVWSNVMVSGKFGHDSPWLYYGDLSLRTTETGRPFSDAGQQFQVSSVITHDAIGYRFDARQSVHLGYAFAYAIPPLAREPTNENRAWQQYTFATPTPLGNLQLRSRLEQRTVNISDSTAVRFRQMVRLAYPLGDAWSLVGANELFLNFNSVDWGPVGGFDQNRVFVGVGYTFNATWRTEIGYMNQYINRDQVYDRDFNLLSLNLFVDVP